MQVQQPVNSAEMKCEKTGKSRFKTLSIAQMHRADAQQKFGDVMRIYDCPHCGDWHLTRRQ